MGLEENIAFVRSQIELYRATLSSSTERLGEYQTQYGAANEELQETQLEIRNLRQALVQPSAFPSIAVIEERIRRQSFLDRLKSMRQVADSLTDEMRATSVEWVKLQELLKKIPRDELTSRDSEKVTSLQGAIQHHLALYGFKSFQPTEIHLSRDNFRPLVYTRQDDEIVEKEINFEVSASDAIRLKWAYYLSLLAIMTGRKTNHCGLVILDEPGQQEMETVSLHALLGWSSENLKSDQQVIVATSEPLESVNRVLSGKEAKVIAFEGFILQPMAESRN